MALLDLFFQVGARPGWFRRKWGRLFTEVCLVPIDLLVEGMYQGRLGSMGLDPPEDAVNYLQRDRRLLFGLKELPQTYMTRLRRWHWSWRATGLAGVANIVLDATNWSGGAIPTQVTGEPSEVGYRLEIVIDGVVGTSGVEYNYSLDAGETWSGNTSLGTSDTIAIGDVTLKWHVGAALNAGTLRIDHGGFGLLLNDIGAAVRRFSPGSSPAGPEGMLHELASVRAPNPPRMKLISADGTWWIREKDGYLWRVIGGYWAWDTAKDSDPEQWARGILVIDEEDLTPWAAFGVEEHLIGEPNAQFGTDATPDFVRVHFSLWDWVTPAVMRLESMIFNFDPDKFDPGDPSTCPDGTWHDPALYDVDGNVTPSRPDYALFSEAMPY